MVGRDRLDLSGSGYGPVASFCEHVMKLRTPINAKNFNYFSAYKLLKKDSVLWSYSFTNGVRVQ